jgi:hypothetical protein
VPGSAPEKDGILIVVAAVFAYCMRNTFKQKEGRMFLHDLHEDQKRAFLRLARDFMRVDGMKPEEKALMATFEREMNMTTSEAAEGELAEIARVFQDRKSKVSVLLELIALGHIDNDFSAAEHEFLAQFVDQFGFDASEFDVLENWVLRQLALMQQADRLRTAPA